MSSVIPQTKRHICLRRPRTERVQRSGTDGRLLFDFHMNYFSRGPRDQKTLQKLSRPYELIPEEIEYLLM